MYKLLTAAVAAACLMMTAPVMAQDYSSGKNYRDDGSFQYVGEQKVEQHKVVEFFSYTCPHCYRLEPAAEKWEKSKADNVKFERIQVIFNKGMKPLAHFYYTAESLGLLDQLHEKMFKAVQNERKRFKNKEAILSWVAAQGIDNTEFAKTYDSFSVKQKVRNGEKLAKKHKLQGVPAMLVDGRYFISGELAGSNNAMFDVANYLTKK
ncbi:thiol:disulfide interchange protein DsbA/DsbL [Pelagibaculum spongiae]|uniref:Thiol:disulfide interchange protein n=1 Tax=Pelagibaculum spongiae TaxID=2080658 RepID=A0A2V1GVF2_9GAMM|nr:thiol:disulfide interchange protein DsbA/DsbL [Pelagibaculum spongiae]PVZ63883.1 disulfide bond formation protein DsbA [Pelagibaculum spongiae]